MLYVRKYSILAKIAGTGACVRVLMDMAAWISPFHTLEPLALYLINKMSL